MRTTSETWPMATVDGTPVADGGVPRKDVEGCPVEWIIEMLHTSDRHGYVTYGVAKIADDGPLVPVFDTSQTWWMPMWSEPHDEPTDGWWLGLRTSREVLLAFARSIRRCGLVGGDALADTLRREADNVKAYARAASKAEGQGRGRAS